MFTLGINASREDWLTAVPPPLARRSRNLTLIGPASGQQPLLSPSRPVLTVFGSLRLLSVAQGGLDRTHRWGPRLVRSAYGAFMLETVFLLGFALALRPFGLPVEAKAVLVAAGAAVCSFAAA